MVVLGRELVNRQGWISQPDYELAYAVARVTPGTSIIAFCAAAGWLILGTMGALAAVFALTAPTAVFAVLLLQAFETGASHPLALSALNATVAAVSGMMGATVYIIVRPFSKGWNATARTIVIGGGAFLASWHFSVSPIPILAATTLAGVLWGGPHKGKSAS